MSGNPVSDEAELTLKYLDDYPDLPANAPLGYPHIVDLRSLSEDFPVDEMSIPDLVVTVLFKYNPAALRTFLDLERPEVHFVHHPPHYSTLDFCIQRTGRVVKIGFLRERQVGGWDELYTYRIDADATGKWTPIAWQGADGRIYHDPKEFLERVFEFAYAVSFQGVWDQSDPGFEIEWFTGLLQGRRI